MSQKKSSHEKLRLKRQELALLEIRARLEEERRQGLPHLYGQKMYSWQHSYFHSKNRHCFITAANQIGKSSIQIRKCIDWATDKNKWKDLWPKKTPKQFWYFYPSSDTATIEFDEKWIADFLPRGKFKDDPTYGWKATYEKKKIHSLEFNSGITIYFKSYEQKLSNLQASTVDAIFADEEMPEDFIPEITTRLSSADTRGYFSMVFTATLAQEVWRLTMEPGRNEEEKYPDAFKLTVSLYDCKTYHDGTPGPWTDELIRQRIAECPTQKEVQRRVYGRFVAESGLMYPSYNPDINFIKPKPIPANYLWSSAIDNGSGGTAHPPAISFLAIAPDFSVGYIFFWKGDDGQTYTAGDVIDKWEKMKSGRALMRSRYDGQAKDLGTIAQRRGHSMEKANKDRDAGRDLLNTLFKAKMLFIIDDEVGEGAKLSSEFVSLLATTPKTKAKDDGIDSTRYAAIDIPWNIPANFGLNPIADESPKELTKEEIKAIELKERRGEYERPNDDGWSELQEEIDEWNDLYG